MNNSFRPPVPKSGGKCEKVSFERGMKGRSRKLVLLTSNWRYYEGLDVRTCHQSPIPDRRSSSACNISDFGSKVVAVGVTREL